MNNLIRYNLADSNLPLPVQEGAEIDIKYSGYLQRQQSQIDQFKKQRQKKIPSETIRLLVVQKDSMMRQLIGYPSLYYSKSFYPLELSQRSFNHLWRICENYELWCNEVG